MNIATISQTFANHWVLFSMLGVAIVLGLWSALASKSKNGSIAKPGNTIFLLLAFLILLCYDDNGRKGRKN